MSLPHGSDGHRPYIIDLHVLYTQEKTTAIHCLHCNGDCLPRSLEDTYTSHEWSRILPWSLLNSVDIIRWFHFHFKFLASHFLIVHELICVPRHFNSLDTVIIKKNLQIHQKQSKQIWSVMNIHVRNMINWRLFLFHEACISDGFNPALPWAYQQIQSVICMLTCPLQNSPPRYLAADNSHLEFHYP